MRTLRILYYISDFLSGFLAGILHELAHWIVAFAWWIIVPRMTLPEIQLVSWPRIKYSPPNSICTTSAQMQMSYSLPSTLKIYNLVRFTVTVAPAIMIIALFVFSPIWAYPIYLMNLNTLAPSPSDIKTLYGILKIKWPEEHVEAPKQWWAYNDIIESMPLYLKPCDDVEYKEYPGVYKVENYHITPGAKMGSVRLLGIPGCEMLENSQDRHINLPLFSLHGWTAATEQEYLSHQQYKNKVAVI